MAEKLTPREFEIYMMIVTRAMCKKDIAAELGIGYQTVDTFTKRIRKKMNMGSSLELLIQYHRKEQC